MIIQNIILINESITQFPYQLNLHRTSDHPTITRGDKQVRTSIMYCNTHANASEYISNKREHRCKSLTQQKKLHLKYCDTSHP